MERVFEILDENILPQSHMEATCCAHFLCGIKFFSFLYQQGTLQKVEVLFFSSFS